VLNSYYFHSCSFFLFATSDNTGVTPALVSITCVIGKSTHCTLCSWLVINKIVFFWNVSITSVKWLLGHSVYLLYTASVCCFMLPSCVNDLYHAHQLVAGDMTLDFSKPLWTHRQWWISDDEISIEVSVLQLLCFEIGVFFKFSCLLFTNMCTSLVIMVVTNCYTIWMLLRGAFV